MAESALAELRSAAGGLESGAVVLAADAARSKDKIAARRPSRDLLFLENQFAAVPKPAFEASNCSRKLTSSAEASLTSASLSSSAS